MNRKRVLFLSRAFPPVVGGIENQNRDVAAMLHKRADTRILANLGGKKALLRYLLKVALRVPGLGRGMDSILLGDGVLTIVAWYFKQVLRRRERVVCIVHGLDVTYGSRLYQWLWVRCFFRSVDHFVAVSEATRGLLVERGVAADRVTVIPNGLWVEASKHGRGGRKRDDVVGQSLLGKRVMLRVGRFVPHKGVLWFVQNVMPRLPEDVVLVAVGGRSVPGGPGDPDVFDDIAACVVATGLEARVILKANIPDEDLAVLLDSADLLVAPNIAWGTSVEGFGINVLEGAAHGRVVLASRYQGLVDAIHEGENGFLVERENPEEWVRAILRLLDPAFDRAAFGAKARLYTERAFGWESLGDRYLEVL